MTDSEFRQLMNGIKELGNTLADYGSRLRWLERFAWGMTGGGAVVVFLIQQGVINLG